MNDHKVRNTGETTVGKDKELMSRCGAGEVRALHELVIYLLPTMKSKIHNVLRQQVRIRRNATQDVSDILQHVVCLLMARGPKTLSRWDPARGLSLKNFGGLFAERVALSWLRSGRLSAWAELPVEPDQLANELGGRHFDAVEQRDLFWKTWEQIAHRFDDTTLRLFKATVIDEESVSEICEHFKLTPNAVYCARRRFRRLVEAHRF